MKFTTIAFSAVAVAAASAFAHPLAARDVNPAPLARGFPHVGGHNPVPPVKSEGPVIAPVIPQEYPDEPVGAAKRGLRPANPPARPPPAPPAPSKAAQPAKPAPSKAARAAKGGKARLDSDEAASFAKRGVDPKLVPDFGVTRGVRLDNFGNCKGVGGKAIPCDCPPPRSEFLASLNANVAAGHAIKNPGVQVSFPTGKSKADQQARINALLVTLQNIHGSGVGCPAVSTVYGELQQKINALPN